MIPSMSSGTFRRIGCRVLVLAAFSTVGALSVHSSLHAQLISQGNSVEFVVTDIVVRGNEQIETGDVLKNLPIRAGETFRQETDGARLIRALYDTELYDDISLSQDLSLIHI